MHSIEKLSANKIKQITKLHQKKYRDELGLFIAEGEKAVSELINESIEITNIYAVKEFGNINFPITYTDEYSMKKISTTSTPCEILAIAKKRKQKINTFKNYKKIALLENISDPGNLGTIIRSAAAFGIEGIILFSDCTELYSPKVIRSCAGNFFKTAVTEIKTKDELKKLFPSHKIISTSLSEKNNITLNDCRNIENIIIMFGSEAKGLSEDLIKIADKNIKLKMENNVESLNIAISASIIFYEIM